MVLLPLRNYLAETRLFIRRVWFAVVLIFICLGLLIGRLVYLQVYQHQVYTTLSDENQLGLIPVDPNRGLIYDRNGVLLAENIPVYSLDVVPDRVTNFQKTLEEVRKIIDISPEEVQQYRKAMKQKRSYEGVPLKLNLTEEQVAKFYLDQYRFPGFGITARLMRNYPQGDTIVSVVGYVGRINEQEAAAVDPANYAATNYIGKLGVEKFYEPQLHGTVGYQQVETDANGRVVRTLKFIPPVSGSDIYLSIDSNLQKFAEQALGSEQGAVVAIDPKNGEVLAFVSNPRYDPNLFVKGITSKLYKVLQEDPQRPLYNRALRGLYPPGSTVKPFYALQALATNTIDTNYKIHDNGQFQLAGNSHIYHDWNWRKGGHGIVDVHKAIVQSCDVFFFNIALKLGITRMDDIMYRFGLGKPTGLDVYEELGGVMPSPKWKRSAHADGWYLGDTVNAGIGQGFTLVTPLQMAVLAAGMANRGVLYQPHFLLKWRDENGHLIAAKPVSRPSVILPDPKVWDIVTSAMEDVVKSGTARRLSVGTGYPIAAKTGTAQVFRPKSYGDEDSDAIPKQYRSHSWLIAFAPADNPKIAVAVLVENLPHQAVIVAKQVLNYYLLPNHGLDANGIPTDQTDQDLSGDGH